MLCLGFSGAALLRLLQGVRFVNLPSLRPAGKALLLFAHSSHFPRAGSQTADIGTAASPSLALNQRLVSQIHLGIALDIAHKSADSLHGRAIEWRNVFGRAQHIRRQKTKERGKNGIFFGVSFLNQLLLLVT